MFTFSVLLENTLLGKFGPKSQNCHFKMKLGTETNSNMLSLMMAFICPVLDWNCSFLVKFGPKNQNCLFKMKVGP